jgi:gluconolactonase
MQSFEQLVPDPAALVKVASGLKFVEGPTWLPDRKAFVFSDIPANTQYMIAPGEGGTWGKPEVFRSPSGNANGTTLDREGRLLICRHGDRDLIRIEKDGSVTVLATHFEGKRLNSPNDVIVAADGAIYFTDPPWGLGKNDKKELDHDSVYRLSPDGKLTKVASEMKAPNGLALSPDGKTLYVAESWWQVKPQFISQYDVKPDGSLGEPRPFFTVAKGTPDGMRVDEHGNVWTSAGEGVIVISPEGKQLGLIPVPESPANLTFGGDDGKTLFITAKTSVYAIRVGVGAAK